jgi:hypothetical protein
VLPIVQFIYNVNFYIFVKSSFIIDMLVDTARKFFRLCIRGYHCAISVLCL